MRKIIFSYILVIALLFGSNIMADAIVADPKPFTYTQPDGSKITIQIYGDEFLNWKRAGNRFVEVGEDGYLYYAYFSSDGSYCRTNSRVGNKTPLGAPSNITIPKTAIDRAYQARAKTSSTNRMRNTSSPMNSLSMGEKRFLVLLIEFSDLHFTLDNPNAAFSNLLNQSGYSANGGTGSVFDYFNDNSGGQFTPRFEVIGPIRVSREYSYYSKNKGFGSPGAADLLVEACGLIDGEVDFSRYDNNQDRDIDNVFFFFAGHNAAEKAEGHIWPHMSGVYGKYYDGVELCHYACSSEYKGNTGTDMCGIGSFCHEFCHVIGLPDFYDTDYENGGQGLALGSYSLMSSGCYNNKGCTPPFLNSIERGLLGWMEAPTALTASGNYTMQPIENNFAYTTPTENSGEYYLYESRQPSKWDAYLPGYGLLIYHIDQSFNEVNDSPAYYRWTYWNGINAFAEHQCFDLVESIYPESSAYPGSQPFPGPNNNTSFTATTIPAAIDWSGNPTGYNLTNISNDNGVSFTLSVAASDEDSPFYDVGINAIKLPTTTFNAGDTITLALLLSNDPPLSTQWFYDGESATEGSTITLTDGEHMIKAVITYSNGDTETITQIIYVK